MPGYNSDELARLRKQHETLAQVHQTIADGHIAAASFFGLLEDPSIENCMKYCGDLTNSLASAGALGMATVKAYAEELEKRMKSCQRL